MKNKSKSIKICITVAAALLAAVIITVPILQSKGMFSAGNKDEYSLENTEELADSPIKGKTVIFLGSSVTYGSASKGESFADFLEKRDGIIAVKEAVSGTTLVDNGAKSYISRMKTIDKNIKADAFICQLSTNDATKKKPLGGMWDDYSMSDFDTETVAGAIEYIIAYVKETWDCPVIFYTGTKYDSEQYEKMVDLLLDVQKKWNIGVIDLWNDADMNAVSRDDYKLYMANGIHPTRAGYREWWLPKFEEYLYNTIGDNT
ncbi:MAG: SGNH/GDSL hydrolase family protein [Oscillospiraceae bacterium]|nr:SGNH/GDSL hydrolase family protein [Oscillospiraceae bacterium]